MAAEVLAMAKQDEIQRLKKAGMKDRAIARALHCSRKTIKKYLQQGMPPQASLIEAKSPEPQAPTPQGVPDSWQERVEWDKVIAEVRSGTPVKVLWEELFEDGKVPVEYPGFWKQFRRRFPELPQSMHRVFAPGSRIEIDYCDGIEILDPVTGELLSTQLFVGVLCHSRYAFAEFTFTQKSADFLASHVRMFEAFGGTAQLLSPDNLKSAVTKVHRYDPVINPAYTRLAAHYEVAVVPARVRTPKDKAIVERTIQIFQRWFYFRIRHRTFTSLIELNASLREHLVAFHAKTHRIMRRTRAEMFESEKPFLHALPALAFNLATHHRAAPYSDCHLVFEKNYYSAPAAVRGRLLDVWATAETVEICHQGERVAFHGRSKSTGKFVTDMKHYPPEHLAYCEAQPEQLRAQAMRGGPETGKCIESLLSGSFPLRHLRRAQGILALAHKYGGSSRLEAACLKANRFGNSNLHYIERILKNGRLEKTPEESRPIHRGPNPLLRGDGLLH